MFGGHDAGLGVRGDEALGLHLAAGEQFAEFVEQFRIFLEAVGEDGLADFHDLAVLVRQDGGAAVLAREQGHFAETVAGLERGDVRLEALAVHDHVGLAVHEDEHGFAGGALLDDFLVAPEMNHLAARQQGVELRVGEAFEDRLLGEHDARGGLHLLFLGAPRPLDLHGADGEGDLDAVTAQAVPDVGADGIADVVVLSLIHEPELDFVFDGRVAKVFQKDFGTGFRRDAFGVGNGVQQNILHARRGCRVINSHRDAHGMLFGRAVEVDDGFAGHFAVRNFDADVVVGDEPGGAPVDFHDLGETVVDAQPVALDVRFANLDGHAGDDVADQVLHRQTDHHRRDAWRDEQFLDALVVKKKQDEKRREQQDEDAAHLGQEFRHFDLVAFLEINLPDVAIHQRDHEHRPEHHRDGGDFLPVPFNSQQQHGHIDRQRNRKQMIRPPKPDAVLAFEMPPAHDHQAVKPRHGQQQQEVFDAGVHLLDSLGHFL